MASTPAPPYFSRVRRRTLLIVIAVCSSAASGAVCFSAYWLLGIPLFPAGAVGRVLLLAPLVTPLLVAPAVGLPVQRATTRVAQLLEQVEATKADLAVEVAERRAAQERLEELARTDPLTGVLNRRGFFEQWATWGDDDLIVVTVDIDRFKEINDRAGHATGDVVLQAVAAELRNAMAGPASVARMGGDEFVVVTPATDQPAIERLQGRLGRLHVERPAGPALEVSCSIGAARLQRGQALDEALAAADARMYRAKRSRHEPAAALPSR